MKPFILTDNHLDERFGGIPVEMKLLRVSLEPRAEGAAKYHPLAIR